MVSNESQAFVLSIVDYHIDYNIKIIILAMIFIYVIALRIWASKLENDSAHHALVKFFAWLLFYPTILFAPLYTIMLFRTYSAINLWSVLLSFYGAIFVVVGFVWLIFGYEFLAKVSGIQIKWSDWADNKETKRDSE
jgi:hypothetical protein